MNLYWSVYKNLEKELIRLADIIHFDDKQMNVYSIHMADLLIRTSVEIEAISKHLYEVNGGNMNPIDDKGDPRALYFDSDCIQELDLKWHITRKVVNVVSANFYFENKENIVLRPLKDCNKQGNGRWKKAYQAVKHNRVEDLSAGNIGNLIRAMAALYILNIYNMEDKVADIGIGTNDVNTSLGSEIFSVNVYKATSLAMGEHIDDSSIMQDFSKGSESTIEATVLIDKYTEDSFREMYKNYMSDWSITKANAERSEQLKLFVANHPEYANKTLNEICIACGEESERKRLGIKDGETPSDEEKALIEKAGERMFISIFSFSNTMNGKKAKRELILNKQNPIYPSL